MLDNAIEMTKVPNFQINRHVLEILTLFIHMDIVDIAVIFSDHLCYGCKATGLIDDRNMQSAKNSSWVFKSVDSS